MQLDAGRGYSSLRWGLHQTQSHPLPYTPILFLLPRESEEASDASDPTCLERALAPDLGLVRLEVTSGQQGMVPVSVLGRGYPRVGVSSL